MKKIIALFCVILLILSQTPFVIATYEKPDVISTAAILMDNKTDKILYSKNVDKKMYPASTTKIMTAILALENCNLTDIVTVSYDTIMSIPDGYVSASLQIGEQLTVEQLLQILLVHSANDAANALGEYVGGSVQSFVSMMNTKVHELGLTNTHFTNTYGLQDDNHFTTARDLAFLMQYCMKNENFRRLAGSASCAIPSTNKYDARKYNSTNELIIPNHSNYYPYLTCGKTGYTTQAGDCLVSCAYKDDLELICVVLGGKNINGNSTRFSETKDLYDYGYSNYKIRTLLQSNDIVTQIEVSNGTKETKNLNLLADSSINVLLENTVSNDTLDYNINLKKDIHAPIEQGTKLGTICYIIDENTYETDLVASHSVEESKMLDVFLIIIIVLFLSILIGTFLYIHRKKKNI